MLTQPRLGPPPGRGHPLRIVTHADTLSAAVSTTMSITGWRTSSVSVRSAPTGRPAHVAKGFGTHKEALRDWAARLRSAAAA
ncbi:hypothetical protein GCM10010390_52920 [Streptomyces mordarskii]|uniref:Uncharacterized protein n=1 Tax=Streptomyces mordarskii TaxID=1226758 RepID=A0ABN1DI51_9ACTN